MIPRNVAFAQGIGSVSGDEFNTFAQVVTVASQLRNFVGLSNMAVQLLGIDTINDGLGGTFYWNGTAVGPDDNLNVIVPFLAAIGAWIRVTYTTASIAPTFTTKTITVADSPYSVAPSDYTIRCDTSGGNVTVVFDVTAQLVGRIIVVLNTVGPPYQTIVNDGTSNVFAVSSPTLPLTIQTNGGSLDLLSAS